MQEVEDARTLSESVRLEARGLRLSAAGALVLAVLGIVWGWAASSQAILFDGLYSVISFVLSWFGVRAATLVAKGPTPKYPFGREALAPLEYNRADPTSVCDPPVSSTPIASIAA